MASLGRPSSLHSPSACSRSLSETAKDLVLEWTRDDLNLSQCISDKEHRWMLESLSGNQHSHSQGRFPSSLQKFMDLAVIDGDELRIDGARLVSVKDYPNALLSLSLSDTQRLFLAAAKEMYAGLPEDLVRKWYALRMELASEADLQVEKKNEDRQSISSPALSESLLAKSRSSTPQPFPEFMPPSQLPSSQPAHSALGETTSDSNITSSSGSNAILISADTASNSWSRSDLAAMIPPSPSLLPAPAVDSDSSPEHSSASEARPSSNLVSPVAAAAEVPLFDDDEELSAMSKPASVLFHPSSPPPVHAQDFIPPLPTLQTSIGATALKEERVGPLEEPEATESVDHRAVEPATPSNAQDDDVFSSLNHLLDNTMDLKPVPTPAHFSVAHLIVDPVSPSPPAGTVERQRVKQNREALIAGPSSGERQQMGIVQGVAGHKRAREEAPEEAPEESEDQGRPRTKYARVKEGFCRMWENVTSLPSYFMNFRR